MKIVKNQFKIWDKTRETYISVSKGKSSWATLTGAENWIINACKNNVNRYAYPQTYHHIEEFEIHVFELVCKEVKTYSLNGKKLEENK